MSEKLLRVYQKFDVHEVKAHLLIYGDLSGQCAHCQQMDIKLDLVRCPACQAEFKYIAFRNIKTHFPKVQKIREERPHWLILDYEDYTRALGAVKAQEFLK